jgi:tRNA-specific 2-thiouridylase
VNEIANKPDRAADPAGRRRFVVAMSGGVDSSVCAWMLCREGLEVVGLFMRNGVHVGEAETSKKSCCSVGDARDARMVAAGLGIAFHAVDLAGEFGSIVRYFIDEYRNGRTPNPCAVCNRDLKFDRLLAMADELGAEGVATGHYARLVLEDGRPRVRRGVDRAKDQSYQLFCVAERHLARARLPLGELEKPAVRELARQAGLRTSAKKDSQEICFVPSNDYRKLLAQEGVALTPGRLVDTAGRELGRHAGVEHFTIGQRRGHGVASVEPLYVVALDPASGEVVLGSRDECASARCVVDDLNWIGFDPPADGTAFRCEVQYRDHCTPAPATLCLVADDAARGGRRAEVEFDEPQAAGAPGQGAAFYRGELLLGGGWILNPSARAAPPPRRAVPARG